MALNLTKAQRLIIIISISFSFFLAEIGVGFYTQSLALVADAFHYLNDLVGFIVALVALKISERTTAPKELSFGWQRATLLGAFFNGVFLLSLGVSIFLQSIERFISIEEVKNPKLVLIIGCVGLALNLISAAFLHEHEQDTKKVVNGDLESLEAGWASSQRVANHGDHRHELGPDQNDKKPSMDLNLMGVLIHVLGDAANNVGVIIAAAVIWKTNYPGRFYADPAVSMAIAFMIFFSSIPLVRKTGEILLESSPIGVNPYDVKHDIEQISGVDSVHELHIWRLNQKKSYASAHIVVTDPLLSDFMKLAQTATECLHAYGIHSATLQPELALNNDSNREGAEVSTSPQTAGETEDIRRGGNSVCRIGCKGEGCQDLACCE